LLFNRLAEHYSINIEIIEVADDRLIQGLKTVDHYFPKSMYYRFLLPEFLPTEERVLYMDGDVMIRSDISNFYSTDLTELACAAVVDQNCDSVSVQNRLRKNRDFEYYNSGVLLINLEYWRNNDITRQLLELVQAEASDLVFPDQDALNILLDGKIARMDYTYNAQMRWINELSTLDFHWSKYNELRESLKNPVIVHFCWKFKPWHLEYQGEYLDEYLAYAQKHRFIGFSRSHRFPFKYRLKRKAIDWTKKLF